MINTLLDFKLLVVFKALLEKKQVSAAAETLGTNQPNVSRALAKLREHFGDPLFVRTQYSMEPTPLAIELSVSIEEMIQLYESKLSQTPVFDPATSTRTFQIAGSEVGHVLLFSRLLPLITKHAPNISLNAVPLGQNALIKELESGNADLAFGPYPKLYAGIHERQLYNESYVCLIRHDHPTFTSKMSIEDFRQGHHILVSSQGLGHIHEQIENQISNVFCKANLKVITHNFLTAALLAEKSDCIVTLPRGAAEALNHRKRLRILKPPIALPNFPIKLYWHERYHRDPAHQWLRNAIYDLFELNEVKQSNL